jgi:LmbE family N-acetylglucosaminyl deacetylase
MDESLPTSSAVDLLVLSPHLDDAVLSLGGSLDTLARCGAQVLVLTLATADPLGELSPSAEDLHRRWGLGADAMAVRREEDLKACQMLGVEALHWPLTDALYRRESLHGEPLYPTLRSLFGSLHEADRGQATALAERFLQLPPAERICAPLAIGRHVDHCLTRLAAELAWGKRLEYYEDFPYARSLRARLRVLRWFWPWRGRTQSLTPASLEAKCRAIACYRSQLGTVFANPQDMEKQVRAFARSRGGEKLWRRLEHADSQDEGAAEIG